MLRSQLFNRYGTQFNVIIMEVHPDENDDDSFCILWYVECERQSSPKKTISVPYQDDGLASLRPDLDNVPNNQFYAAIARVAMSTVSIEVSATEPNVLEVVMMDKDSTDPGCRVAWNTHVSSFNPTAWAKVT